MQFIITICLYIIIPICIKTFFDDKFTNKQASIISFINSLIIFFMIVWLFKNDGLNNICMSLMFIIVNYFILKIDKEKNIPTTKIN